MDKNSSNHQPPASQNNISAGEAVFVGHLVVNLPVLVIMAGFTFAGLIFAPSLWFIFLLVGFVLAWLWWSFAVPRWRQWALDQGAPAERLQKLAVATGLVWPKGSIFEKTEFKIDE